MQTCPSQNPFYEDALSISFSFRKQIWNVFCDVIGLHEIDYISINIVDKNGKIIFFTSNPSFYYNFFSSIVFKYDKFLSPEFYKSKGFYSWVDAFDKKHYSDLLFEKTEKYKFSFGFCFVRKISGFHVIYSFASKSKIKNPGEYYLNNADDMLRIGDICYNSLKNIYQKLSNKKAPSIRQFHPFNEKVFDVFENDPGNVIFFNTCK